jgi:hypothetical protein
MSHRVKRQMLGARILCIFVDASCPNGLKRYVLTKLLRRIKDPSVKALNPLLKEKYLSACNWSEYSNKPGNVSILVGVNLKEGRGVRSLSPRVGLCFLMVQTVGWGAESQEK